MSWKDVEDFIKGLIPFYGFLEKLVAPPYGKDVWDYAYCRVNCDTTDPAIIAARVKECQDGMAAIARKAFVSLGFELGGVATFGGVAFGFAKDAIKPLLIGFLEKKGLVALAQYGIPIFGWISLVGEVFNLLALLLYAWLVWKAYWEARGKWCICPN